MRKTITLLCLLGALAMLAMSCAKPVPAPMSAQQYFDSGLTYFNQENYPQAAWMFEQAVALSPSMQDAHYYLGLSYWKQNMSEKAKASFINVLNLNPNHLKARESLGLLYYNEHNYLEAKKHLEAARNLNSINPEVFLALGGIYMLESRCPEALDVFQRGLSVDSSNLALQNAYAEALRVCGKPQPAVSAPKVIHEKKFRGGGKALDPSEF